MSDNRQNDPNYQNWRNGQALPANYPGPGNGNGNCNQAPQGEAGGCGRRRWNRNRNRPQPASASTIPTMAAATTDAERQAAAANFWATVTPSRLAGFPSNAKPLANNLADETRNRSLSVPLPNTPYFLDVHRPLEKDENPFDGEMSPPRAAAVMGGFVQRVEDLGRLRVRWEGQEQEPKNHKVKKQEWYVNNVLNNKGRKGDKGKNPRGGGGGGGRGNSAPPRGYSCGTRRGQEPQGAFGQQPRGQPSLGHGHDYHDPRDFADTDKFYLDPAGMAQNVKDWNPEATAFEPPDWCKPSGSFGPSRRKDDPDRG